MGTRCCCCGGAEGGLPRLGPLVALRQRALRQLRGPESVHSGGDLQSSNPATQPVPRREACQSRFYALSRRRAAFLALVLAGGGQGSALALASFVTGCYRYDPWCYGVLSAERPAGVAELKEDGQVSCDTAQNLRFTCSYINYATRPRRSRARVGFFGLLRLLLQH